MHVAQFVQRYPPALGGSEAYAARLCDYLTAHGDTVSVWTSSAVALEEMWRRLPPPLVAGRRENLRLASSNTADPTAFETAFSPYPQGSGREVGFHPYPPLHFPLRRYVLKAFSLLPHRRWQCLTTPTNPICPAMWLDAGRFDGPLDAVHATAFPYSFPIACGLRLARRREVPFLLTPFLHLGDPRNPHDRTRKQYTAPHLSWLLRQADRILVQTQAERDAVISLDVPAERVVLQGLGVDAREVASGSPGALRATCDFADQVLVGHLANNSAEKGTIDLLHAAQRAWAAGHCFRVVLAGPEMPNFRAFWKTFPAKDRVSRLGVLSDEQKRDFFAGIDSFVLPSRCDSFGLVLLEAWANGKPNLVYRAGGPAEVVRDGLDGLHAACGDIEELAAQLGRLVADPELRRRLGECGRARVAREFRWSDKLELVRETILSLRPHSLQP